MEECGLHIPHTVREAVIFYVELLDALENVCRLTIKVVKLHLVND